MKKKNGDGSGDGTIIQNDDGSTAIFYSGDEKDAVKRAKIDDIRQQANRRYDSNQLKLKHKMEKSRAKKEVRIGLKQRVGIDSAKQMYGKFDKLSKSYKTLKTDPFRKVSIDAGFKNIDRVMSIKVPTMKNELRWCKNLNINKGLPKMNINKMVPKSLDSLVSGGSVGNKSYGKKKHHKKKSYGKKRNYGKKRTFKKRSRGKKWNLSL